MQIAGFEFNEQVARLPGENKDANAVGQRLEKLRKDHGGELTPHQVLADARSERSPLHQYFTWDDSEAANQHRLEQARLLIRTVVAIYRDDKSAERHQRAYVHIRSEPPKYMETMDALSKPDTREIVLRSALGELRAWRKKYADLQELAAVVAVIDEAAA